MSYAHPTLDALPMESSVVTLDDAELRKPPLAHRFGAPCGEFVLDTDQAHMPAEFARWFAVPCRDCFPDAPEPGERPCLIPGCRMDHGRYLSWQVAR